MPKKRQGGKPKDRPVAPYPEVYWRSAKGFKLHIHEMHLGHLKNTINRILRMQAEGLWGDSTDNPMVFEDTRTKAGVHFPVAAFRHAVKQEPRLLAMLDEMWLREHPGYAMKQERYHNDCQEWRGKGVYDDPLSDNQAERASAARGFHGEIPRYSECSENRDEERLPEIFPAR